MKKVTEDVLLDYVTDVGEFEKEHRKYSTFYCSVSHTITQKDVDCIAQGCREDASDFLGVNVTRNGMWDDSYGTEWESVEYSKVEEYKEFVPEVVIPEHYVTKYKTHPFDPVWDEGE